MPVVEEIMDGLGELAIGCTRQVHGRPAWAADAHVLFVIGHRNSAQHVALAAPRPKLTGLVGESSVAGQTIDENQEAAVTFAEYRCPALQAVDVVLGGPALPNAPRFFGRSTGITAALDIDQEPETRLAVDDEIEVLDACV